jgi:hypothetical protein
MISAMAIGGLRVRQEDRDQIRMKSEEIVTRGLCSAVQSRYSRFFMHFTSWSVCSPRRAGWQHSFLPPGGAEWGAQARCSARTPVEGTLRSGFLHSIFNLPFAEHVLTGTLIVMMIINLNPSDSGDGANSALRVI